MELRRVASALLLSLLTSLLMNPASAQTSELFYDDGTFDYAWSDFYPLGAAVRFSPPTVEWRVEEVSFYGLCSIRGSQGVFYVEVWDQNMRNLYHEAFSFRSFFSGRNSTADWYSIQLDVLVRGDFYVVIVPCFTLEGSQLWIGADEDPPTSNRSFLVDARRHEVVQAWDAEGKMPKDLMVRVEGRPVPGMPELRLASVEESLGGTTLGFEISGSSIRAASATLLHEAGSEEGCDVAILDNCSLSVSARGGGELLVSVSTDLGVVSASVMLGGDLRESYGELLRTVWELRNESALSKATVESLRRENALLRDALNQSEVMVSVLGRRVEEMEENVTSLVGELASLNEAAEGLKAENQRLWAALSVVFVAMALALVEVLRRWKR
jgi:hypothetical protein